MTDEVQKLWWLDMTAPASTHDPTAFFSARKGGSWAELGTEESGSSVSRFAIQSLDNVVLQPGECVLPNGHVLMCHRNGGPFGVSSTDEARGAFL